MQAKSITPILNVSNLEESFAWFQRLGWTKGFNWEGSFGAVCSGESEIFLCVDGQGGRGKSAHPTTFGQNECADKGVWMSIWVESVDDVHAHCRDQEIEITMPPHNMAWGVREMHVRHPDGHVFRISQGLEVEQS